MIARFKPTDLAWGNVEDFPDRQFRENIGIKLTASCRLSYENDKFVIFGVNINFDRNFNTVSHLQCNLPETQELG